MPSNSRGWIKMHRSIMENWVFQSPALFRAWCYVLMKANHQKAKIIVKGNLQTIETGQFWTSYRTLSRDLEVSQNTVRRWFTQFQDDGMISLQPMQGCGTLVTVCNYGLYQGFSGDGWYTDGHTDGHTDGYNAGTLTDVMTDHEQEINNDKECIKNEKKKYIAPPGYGHFSEV